MYMYICIHVHMSRDTLDAACSRVDRHRGHWCLVFVRHCSCIYEYICIYVYAYVYMYIFIYKYICIYVETYSMHRSAMRALMPYICASLLVYVWIYMYIYVCICTCVCVYILYICIHVETHSMHRSAPRTMMTCTCASCRVCDTDTDSDTDIDTDTGTDGCRHRLSHHTHTRHVRLAEDMEFCRSVLLRLAVER